MTSTQPTHASTSANEASTVTIIGAGPSGLLLARLLQNAHVPVAVYEAESGPHARNQGGTLDLHPESGIAALKESGLWDEVMRKARTGDAENMKVMKMTGEVVLDENEEKQGGVDGEQGQGEEEDEGRPEIDRTDLRAILIDSLAPGTIHWSHKISHITATSLHSYAIHFTAPSRAPLITSILIGADGTWSKVRPLILSSTPFYTGLTMFDLQIPSSRMSADLCSLVGKGTCMIFGDGKGLIPQMNAGGKCRAYAAIYNHEERGMGSEEVRGKVHLPERGQKKWVKGLYEGWDERCARLVDAAEEESIVERKIMTVDPDLRWETDISGVTIIGDAAHVMAPSGEGVNLALHDALILSQALIDHHADDSTFSNRPKLHTALRDFERGMMERASGEIETSNQMLDLCYGQKDGAAAFGDFMREMMAGGPGAGADH